MMRDKILFAFFVMVSFVWAAVPGMTLKDFEQSGAIKIDENHYQVFEFGQKLLLRIELKNGMLTSLEWQSPTAPSFDELWGFLDWASGGADWYFLDAKAYMDQELKQKYKGRPDTWVSILANKRLLAQLWDGAGGYTLKVDLLSFSSVVKQAKWVYKSPSLKPFYEYHALQGSDCLLKQEMRCSWVHEIDARISLEVQNGKWLFTYVNPDKEMLKVPENFTSLGFVEQQNLMREWYAYLEYEYAIIIKTFMETTSELFSWQTWHWLDAWQKNKLSEEMLRSFLSAGHNNNLEIFRYALQGGGMVLMTTDLNGGYRMEILP
jgi:hypothetical protein